MPDMDSIYMDAIEDERHEKYIKDHELIHEEQAVEYADEQKFILYCSEIINKYNLEDYSNKLEKWNNLKNTDRLEYCYILLNENTNDDFCILRQVDVFQKLINLDFENFNDINYYRVLECAFFDKIDDDTNNTKSFQVIYNPLIPNKHYESYLKKLKTKSKVSSLSIPLDNVTNYLKDLLYTWYLHKHSKLTSYSIESGDYYFNTIPDDKKTIQRNITKLTKLTD